MSATILFARRGLPGGCVTIDYSLHNTNWSEFNGEQA